MLFSKILGVKPEDNHKVMILKTNAWLAQHSGKTIFDDPNTNISDIIGFDFCDDEETEDNNYLKIGLFPYEEELDSETVKVLRKRYGLY